MKYSGYLEKEPCLSLIGSKLVVLILSSTLSFCYSIVFAEYKLTPIFHSSIGKLAPLEFYPIAVTVDQDGYVYLVDLYRKTIQKRSPDGTLLAEFATDALWPRNIAIDENENLYLIDSFQSSCKVMKYSPEGELLKAWGYPSNSAGGFGYPQGIAVNGNGQIIVIDGMTQISAFDRNGLLLWNNMETISPEGRLKDPQAVAIGQDDSIFVADTSNRRIAVFDCSGTFMGAIGFDVLWTPVGIAIASDGSILVHDRRQYFADIGISQIYKFSQKGELMSSWGHKGRGSGELWEAHGVAIGPDDTLWVAGYHGHNVISYDLDGTLLHEWNDNKIVGGEFAQVYGTTIGEGGNAYVVDFWNQNTHVFDRYGNFLFLWGERGQGDGQFFNFPRHTATDSVGNIYISDDREIRKFDNPTTQVSLTK